MGKAWSNEPFSSNVKSRLGLFDTSFENRGQQAAKRAGPITQIPKELQSQRSFQIERTCKVVLIWTEKTQDEEDFQSWTKTNRWKFFEISSKSTFLDEIEKIDNFVVINSLFWTVWK